ncbi:MAG: Fic family protein [Campylobacteraceae bacterium]|jgi:Fic family protein|nr:Fic family protein [Campylobacteraceae bacterium]
MDNYQNRFNMTLEENIFWAKRNIVDYIYKSARMEGLNVTFPQTYAIYERAKEIKTDIRTVEVIVNLKHAWQYLLNNISDTLDFEFIKKIHSEIARGEALTWGELRSGKVHITGTDYVPPVPNENDISISLKQLLSIENPTQRAISVMLWGMRSQLFWDGNKRTAMMMANKIMIKNGCGVITVSPENLNDFSLLLSDYYTTGSSEKIKRFIYENCIDGVDFPKK